MSIGLYLAYSCDKIHLIFNFRFILMDVILFKQINIPVVHLDIRIKRRFRIEIREICVKPRTRMMFLITISIPVKPYGIIRGRRHTRN